MNIPSSIDEAVERLNGLIKVQTQSLSDEYMRGLANGLILARSVLNDEEPLFLEWSARTIKP